VPDVLASAEPHREPEPRQQVRHDH
jgi:hypothetical protein